MMSNKINAGKHVRQTLHVWVARNTRCVLQKYVNDQMSFQMLLQTSRKYKNVQMFWGSDKLTLRLSNIRSMLLIHPFIPTLTNSMLFVKSHSGSLTSARMTLWPWPASLRPRQKPANPPPPVIRWTSCLAGVDLPSLVKVSPSFWSVLLRNVTGILKLIHQFLDCKSDSEQISLQIVKIFYFHNKSGVFKAKINAKHGDLVNTYRSTDIYNLITNNIKYMYICICISKHNYA